jgi:hypothetical protein
LRPSREAQLATPPSTRSAVVEWAG